ncbi:MAG: outer membrane beta-barrel domain-containing protein [Oligoflexia bacterium]|nr:outer membrane beta-barrel domain-containing protein [Oligoflexia bacterium]
MKALVVLIIGVLSLNSQAAEKINLKKDFDSLGGNAEIVGRAQALDPENQVKIVQNRTVDRNNRFELGVNYSMVSGGDTYMRTQNLGGNLDFHLTPSWSVGARYYKAYSSLTAEGQNIYDDANRRYSQGYKYNIPPIDYPIETGLLVVNWYPIYGKLNLFNLGVAHFDIYTLIGYGKMFLDSGSSDTYTAGGGVGFWWTQNIASRLEVRYQPYTDLLQGEKRHQDSVVFTASVGVLL